jgi:hypothetical protein
VAISEPGIRRLCVAISAEPPGLLLSARRSGSFDRLYVHYDPASGSEFGLAAPGDDEIGLITDLIELLSREVAIGRADPPVGATLRFPHLALAVFHVGITRLVDDSLGGPGVARTRALSRSAVVRSAAHSLIPCRPGRYLAVAISAGLFAELQDEGLPAVGWQQVGPADVWMAHFPSR